MVAGLVDTAARKRSPGATAQQWTSARTAHAGTAKDPHIARLQPELLDPPTQRRAVRASRFKPMHSRGHSETSDRMKVNDMPLCVESSGSQEKFDGKQHAAASWAQRQKELAEARKDRRLRRARKIIHQAEKGVQLVCPSETDAKLAKQQRRMKPSDYSWRKLLVSGRMEVERTRNERSATDQYNFGRLTRSPAQDQGTTEAEVDNDMSKYSVEVTLKESSSWTSSRRTSEESSGVVENTVGDAVIGCSDALFLTEYWNEADPDKGSLDSAGVPSPQKIKKRNELGSFPEAVLSPSEEDSVQKVFKDRQTFWRLVKGSTDTDSDKDTIDQVESLRSREVAMNQYVSRCSAAARSPVSSFLRSVTTPGGSVELNLDYFGLGKAQFGAAAPYLPELKLKRAHLSENRMGDAGLRCGVLPMLKSSQQLQELSLSNNGLSDRGIELLTSSLGHSGSLTALDLRGNKISYRGVEGLCESLKLNTALLRLNLSDNLFGAGGTGGGSIVGVSSIAMMLQINSSLHHLDISHNNLGCACDELGQALAKNRALTHLNISFCGLRNAGAVCFAHAIVSNNILEELVMSNCLVGDIGACMIGYGLRRNAVINLVKLDGNPLGINGGRSLIRGMKKRGGKQLRTISMAGCSCYHSELSLDYRNPDGDYVLDLADPHDNAIASELWEIAVRQDGENWIGETLDKKPLDIPEELANPWIMPQEGVLRTKFISSPTPPTMADVMDADMFNNLLNMCKDAETDRERVRLLLSAGADEYFDADKVLAAVNQIIDSSERVSVAKGLFCRLVDLERSRKFLDVMQPTEALKVHAIVGQLASFDPTKPSARFKLDLSSDFDFTLARRVVQMAYAAKTKRMSLGRADTSKDLDGIQMRDIVLNGEPLTSKDRYTVWQSHKDGILEFTFVSTDVAFSDARPLNDEAFSELSEQVEAAAVDSGRKNVQKAAALVQKHFVSSRQLMQLATTHFKDINHSEWKAMTEVEWAERGEACRHEERAELILRCLQSIVDLQELWPSLVCTFDPLGWSKKEGAAPELWSICRRIGWLNVFNPCYPDCNYELNLAVPEERRICEILVELGVFEPGENWQNESLNRKPFFLPKSWVKSQGGDVPKKGLLHVRYHTDPGCAIMRKRTLCADVTASEGDDFLGALHIAPGEVRPGQTEEYEEFLRNVPQGRLRLRISREWDCRETKTNRWLFIVTILDADDLMGMDSTGQSDPYVELEWKEDQRGEVCSSACTSVKYQTVIPKWNESFEVYMREPFGSIRLRVFDSDEDTRRTKHNAEVGTEKKHESGNGTLPGLSEAFENNVISIVRVAEESRILADESSNYEEDGELTAELVSSLVSASWDAAGFASSARPEDAMNSLQQLLVLSKTPLIDVLSDEGVEHLCSRLDRCELPIGAIDANDCFYVLIEGIVQLKMNIVDAEGVEHTAEKSVSTGQAFGERWLMAGSPSETDLLQAECQTDCKLLKLTQAAFIDAAKVSEGIDDKSEYDDKKHARIKENTVGVEYRVTSK